MGLLKSIKANLGNTYAKGDVFEELVAELFPERVFRVIHYTSGSNDLNGRRIESRNMPDLQFEHIPSGHRFWVECKFRSDLYHDKLTWAEDWQFKRYRDFQSECRPEKVFVVIGFGGRATRPDRMYCIPLDEIKYCGLYLSSIGRYQRPLDKDFWYEGGRLV